jgi:lipoprotein
MMKKNAVLAAGVLVLGLAGCGQGAGQSQSASDGGQQAATDAALNWVQGTAKVRCELESENYKYHSSGCSTQDNSTPAWSGSENYRVKRTVRWGKDAWAVVIAEGENDSTPAVLGMVNEGGRWVLKSRGELNQIAKGSKNSECAALSGPNAPECAD